MTDYEIALTLLDSKQRYSESKVKSNPNLVNQIKDKYKDSLSLRETIYRIVHHIDVRPVCLNCGKQVNFVGKIKLPYRQYCCFRCSRECSLTMERMKKTCENRYGGIGFASKELYEKSENKSKELYGENYRKDVQQVKARKTKLEKYGDENYNNRESAKLNTDHKAIYESYKKTMQLKYGVDNYFQSEECRLKCNNKESLIKAQETRIKNGTLRTSKIEKQVLNYIKENHNFTVEENKRKYLDGKEIDIYLPEFKLGFEIQGDFFHKNPKFYKDPNELANLPRTDQSLTVQNIWQKDKAKLELAKSKGITLVQIWEDEIKNDFEKVTKQLEELFQQFLKE